MHAYFFQALVSKTPIKYIIVSSQCFCTSAFESHNLHTIHISVSQKKPDALNLSMSEVNVTGLQGDQQYQCVLEKIESKEIICKIKGGSGAITSVDSITVRLFMIFSIF